MSLDDDVFTAMTAWEYAIATPLAFHRDDAARTVTVTFALTDKYEAIRDALDVHWRGLGHLAAGRLFDVPAFLAARSLLWDHNEVTRTCAALREGADARQGEGAWGGGARRRRLTHQRTTNASRSTLRARRGCARDPYRATRLLRNCQTLTVSQKRGMVKVMDHAINTNQQPVAERARARLKTNAR